MAEFKMAAIIKLSENEWVRVFCKWWEPILASVSQFERKKLRWHNFKMAEFKMAAIIELSENEWVWVRLKLVWVRVRVEWECFQWIWEKVPRCLNPRWQNSRWLPSSSWVRMNEWRFFLCKWWEPMSETFFVQMVTNLGKYEFWEDKLRWLNSRWWNLRWQNSRWLPSSSWVRMNVFESDWISLSQSQSGVRVFLSESERRYQGVWIQDGRIQDGCHHQVESQWMNEGFLCKWGNQWMSEVFFLCKW